MAENRIRDNLPFFIFHGGEIRRDIFNSLN